MIKSIFIKNLFFLILVDIKCRLFVLEIKKKNNECFFFYISISLWSFIGVWVTAGLHRSLLIIQADLNNSVARREAILPVISNSSSLLSKLLETVPNVLVITGISIFTFSCFSGNLVIFNYLSIISLSFIFTIQWHETVKPTRWQGIFSSSSSSSSSSSYYYYYYYFTPYKFFTLALADSFSLESEL